MGEAKDNKCGNDAIRTEETKEHFDDIYLEETPVPFKERIMDRLDYVPDEFNRRMFDRHILPWCEKEAAGGRTLRFVDLCSCFGNTTLATVFGMSVEAIRENWKDAASCRRAAQPRRLPLHVTGIDISAPALGYGKSAGIFDDILEADLNNPTVEARAAVDRAMAGADVVVSSAALVYLELPAVKALIEPFARAEREGFLLVNFLNPFALDKADAMKRLLLDRLDFVGSMASRHRRLSEPERRNHPGEEWVLLELWVLGRRG